MAFHRVNKVCLAPQDRMAHLDPWWVGSIPLFLPPSLSPTCWMCGEVFISSVLLSFTFLAPLLSVLNQDTECLSQNYPHVLSSGFVGLTFTFLFLLFRAHRVFQVWKVIRDLKEKRSVESFFVFLSYFPGRKNCSSDSIFALRAFQLRCFSRFHRSETLSDVRHFNTISAHSPLNDPTEGCCCCALATASVLVLMHWSSSRRVTQGWLAWSDPPVSRERRETEVCRVHKVLLVAKEMV